jgi:hypothetical protein
LPPLDFDAAALAAVQRAEGVALTPEQQQQILLREKVRHPVYPITSTTLQTGLTMNSIVAGDDHRLIWFVTACACSNTGVTLCATQVPPSAALAREGGILHGIKLGDS